MVDHRRGIMTPEAQVFRASSEQHSARVDSSMSEEDIKRMLRDSAPGEIITVSDKATKEKVERLAGMGYEDIIIRIETPQ